MRKAKRTIMTCKKHGETEFRLYKEKDNFRWRCFKCNMESVAKRRKKIKEKAIEYLGGKCSKCGYSKCSRALEFHHINPEEKDFGLSQKGLTRAWERTRKELDKCILLCSNCHAELHEQIENEKNIPF